MKAGRIRRTGTKRRTPAQPELRHAAAGLQGSDAHPAKPMPEANAARETRASARPAERRTQRQSGVTRMGRDAQRLGGALAP